MKEKNLIRDKSYQFALKIINVFKHLQKDKNEFVLSKQLLKSGTSIGANIEEAIGGQTKKDFFTKITIAYKEARETNYWIRLLRDSHYLSDELAQQLLNDCNEILKILGTIQISLKNKI